MTESSHLTVADFVRLPQSATRQELRHGKLIESPPARKLHGKLQKRLVSLVEAGRLAAGLGVDKEFPFRPAPEHEVWVADVAVFSLSVWEQTADDDYYFGVPAVVIEVLSPSDTASEMFEREEICLGNGGQEFWMVDPQRESVKVIRAGGYSSVFAMGSVLESGVLTVPIAVRGIFAG